MRHLRVNYKKAEKSAGHNTDYPVAGRAGAFPQVPGIGFRLAGLRAMEQGASRRRADDTGARL